MHRTVLWLPFGFAWLAFPVPGHGQCSPSGQCTLFVNIAVSSSGTGCSFNSPLKYLQDALAAASDGDVICLAEGSYFPDQGTGFTPGDRSAAFHIPDGVALYGGFEGSFSQDSPGDRPQFPNDIEEFPTILSGDLLDDSDSDPWTTSDDDDNSYSVVITSGAQDSTALIDRVTIEFGVGDDVSSGCDYFGGGITHLESSSTLSLIDCTLRNTTPTPII